MEPLLPFRDGESKRAGRPSSRDGARDVCSKRLRAPADAADPRESTDRPSGLAGARTGDGGVGAGVGADYFLALKPLTHNITFAPLVHSRSRLNYRTRSREPSDSPFDSPRLRSTH